ncbi:MAG: T9SS type A sorting domain-containing protein [Chitinophagaceae bacterium]|nr:T9SS type A sorting domain-containing protein [Chitinophagaceae bacterium]
MNQTSTIIKALCLLLFPTALWGQSLGDFRSVATGNWNNTATWERYDGAIWVTPAPSTPSSLDGAITIQNGHTVTVTASVTIDQVTVDAGGTLTNNQSGANLTVNDGTGTDLLVNGTYNLGSVTVANTLAAAGAAPSVQVNGTMNWRNGTMNVATTIGGAGTLNLSENFAKLLNTTLTINGTMNWQTGSTAGGIGIVNGASLINNGTINEQFQSNNRGIAVNGGGTATFINNGIINKTTTFLMEIYATVIFTNNGTIKGIGTFQCDAPPSNSGIIAPGNSPGILTVSSNLVQGQPTTIQAEVVDGSGVGTGHDQLRFTANVNLTGVTINIQDFSVAPPAPLQNYTVLTTTGTFSGTPTFVSGSNYSLVTPIGATAVEVTKNASFPLPAVWGSFIALARNNQVVLNWETLQETNVTHFTIEYSSNGRDYLPLGTVNAAGNSNSLSKYSFTHNLPDLQKSNYYRIRQSDVDGKSAISAVRLVKFGKAGLVSVTALPNPVRDRLQLQVQADDIRVILTDLAGRSIKSMQLQPGYHEINMSRMAPGMYQLVIYKEGRILETQKIVKQ